MPVAGGRGRGRQEREPSALFLHWGGRRRPVGDARLRRRRVHAADGERAAAARLVVAAVVTTAGSDLRAGKGRSEPLGHPVRVAEGPVAVAFPVAVPVRARLLLAGRCGGHGHGGGGSHVSGGHVPQVLRGRGLGSQGRGREGDGHGEGGAVGAATPEGAVVQRRSANAGALGNDEDGAIPQKLHPGDGPVSSYGPRTRLTD